MHTRLSIIIPVYQAARHLQQTVEQVHAIASEIDQHYELILVNDGSRDDSWTIITRLASKYPIVGIDLLRNVGQHTALLCGMTEARGEWIVHIDDDLQNPPASIPDLVKPLTEGYDLVFARFKRQQYGFVRRWSSEVINRLNEFIFKKPTSIRISNFRAYAKAINDRVVAAAGHDPYITGLLVFHASNIVNVDTPHHNRAQGESTYSAWKLFRLAARLLFGYSSLPLRWLIIAGLLISLFSFALGAFFLLKALVIGIPVPGWTSIVVLLSFFNGFLMLMLGMLGEYVIRLQRNIISKSYHITRRV